MFMLSFGYTKHQIMQPDFAVGCWQHPLAGKQIQAPSWEAPFLQLFMKTCFALAQSNICMLPAAISEPMSMSDYEDDWLSRLTACPQNESHYTKVNAIIF